MAKDKSLKLADCWDIVRESWCVYLCFYVFVGKIAKVKTIPKMQWKVAEVLWQKNKRELNIKWITRVYNMHLNCLYRQKIVTKYSFLCPENCWYHATNRVIDCLMLQLFRIEDEVWRWVALTHTNMHFYRAKHMLRLSHPPKGGSEVLIRCFTSKTESSWWISATKFPCVKTVK